MSQTILFKRGLKQALEAKLVGDAKPKLGEPVYEIPAEPSLGALPLMKIGDGQHDYIDLPYLGGTSPMGPNRLVYDSIYEFPTVGSTTWLYVTKTGNTYIWNATKLCYQVLYNNNKQFYEIIGEESDGTLIAERQIDGGAADDTVEANTYRISNFEYSNS